MLFTIKNNIKNKLFSLCIVLVLITSISISIPFYFITKQDKISDSQIRMGIAFDIIKKDLDDFIKDKTYRIQELLKQISAIRWELTWYNESDDKAAFFNNATYSSYITTIGQEFTQLSNFISADRIFLYTKDRRLLVSYVKGADGKEHVNTYAKNSENEDTFLSIDDYSRLLIRRSELPVNPLDRDIPSHLIVLIPDEVKSEHYVESNKLGLRITAPIYNNGQKVGAIVTETYYRQSMAEDYANLSQSEVNFFINDRFYFGTLKSHNDFSLWQKDSYNEMENTINSSNQVTEITSITVNNHEYYQGIRYLTDINYQMLGIISVNISKELENRQIKKILQTIAIISFISIIISFALAILLSRKTLRSIKNLTDSSSEIAEGNLDYPIDINSKDELGILAHSFSIMRESIKRQLSELKTEIKEHKVTTEKLMHLRNYLTNIIDSMPSMLIGVDANGVITQWNLEAAKITGYTTEETIGKKLDQIIPRLSPHMKQIEKAIETREKIFNPKLKHDVDGKSVYEDLTIYPLVINGEVGAVIRVDNITKEFEIEQQLNQSRKMDAIGQLAGGIAHDFNNMLAAIMAAAQILQNPKRNLDEKGLQFVNMILDASKQSADLVSKLLAFGRKGKVSSSTVDIHHVIDETVSLLSRTIDKRIKIIIIKQADSPTIIGDKTAILNALLNLGINASYSMPKGGSLTLESRNVYLNKNYCELSQFDISEGHYLEVAVRDTGCGIPQENINKIFEPFFTTKEQGVGSGLGLASVYGTVQDHKGSINVYSELGTGTVFHLYIPCSTQAVESVKKDEPLIHGTGKVLLVDDEDLILKTGKFTLEELGYTVVTAKNGAEAVDMYKNIYTDIDLVIMDMIMPEMNGSEAFYEMKKINPDCKVIISSGFTKDENLNQLKNDGLLGHMQKPFRDSELSKLLSELRI